MSKNENEIDNGNGNDDELNPIDGLQKAILELREKLDQLVLSQRPLNGDQKLEVRETIKTQLKFYSAIVVAVFAVAGSLLGIVGYNKISNVQEHAEKYADTKVDSQIDSKFADIQNLKTQFKKHEDELRESVNSSQELLAKAHSKLRQDAGDFEKEMRVEFRQIVKTAAVIEGQSTVLQKQGESLTKLTQSALADAKEAQRHSKNALDAAINAQKKALTYEKTGIDPATIKEITDKLAGNEEFRGEISTNLIAKTVKKEIADLKTVEIDPLKRTQRSLEEKQSDNRITLESNSKRLADLGVISSGFEFKTGDHAAATRFRWGAQLSDGEYFLEYGISADIGHPDDHASVAVLAVVRNGNARIKHVLSYSPRSGRKLKPDADGLVKFGPDGFSGNRNWYVRWIRSK